MRTSSAFLILKINIVLMRKLHTFRCFRIKFQDSQYKSGNPKKKQNIYIWLETQPLSFTQW
jgi:hypothetical protein